MKKILLPAMAIMALASGVQASNYTLKTTDQAEEEYEELYDLCYNDRNANACVNLIANKKQWDNNILPAFKDFGEAAGKWFSDLVKSTEKDRYGALMKAGVTTQHRGKEISAWNVKDYLYAEDRDACWELEEAMHNNDGALAYLESIFGDQDFIYVVGGDEGDGTYRQSTWKSLHGEGSYTIKTRCDFTE